MRAASLAKWRIASDCQTGSERSWDATIGGSLDPGLDRSDERGDGFELLDADERWYRFFIF